MAKKKKKETRLPLKNIPKDVKKYLLKIQGEIKEEKGVSQFSLCLTVYKIIREHKKIAGSMYQI